MNASLLWLAAGLTGAYWLSLVARARLLPSPLPTLSRPHSAPDRPLVSILVAVRNEMNRMLVESVSSFIAQDYPTIEIVAVDDHSEDDSRRVLARLADDDRRLRVIDAPDDAAGKRAALIAAVDAARGSWLLFTDADVRLAPDAVRRGVDHAIHHRIDALSLLPRTTVISLAEQIAMAAVSWLVWEGTALRRCNHDGAPVGLAAAGPYLLVSRAAFDAVGGYAAIRQNVLVDVALATRLRTAGFRYRYLRSDNCVETRMYRSLGEIWRGFGKNAYVALGRRPGLGVAAVAAAAAVMLAPPLLTGFGLVRGDPVATSLGVAAYVSMAAAQRSGAVFMGARVGLAALALSPLGALFWLAIVVQSAWMTRARGTVVWKGRALPVMDR